MAENIDPDIEVIDSKIESPADADSGMANLLWMHGMFFLMALFVVVMSILMRSEGDTAVYLPGTSLPLPDTCMAKRMLGIPCPGCGMTRAFISIGHGQLARAWDFNPASYVLYLFVAVQIPWHAMQYWLCRRRGYGVTLPFIHFIPIAMAAVLLMQWLWRFGI
jgi:hypothetical protein